MAARQIIVPGAMPSRDANGRSLPAKLRFYEPGTALTTPATVYADSSLSVPHTFPLLSNSAGRWPQIWADEAEVFDVAWSDQVADAQIATFTDIRPTADGVLSSLLLAQQAASEAEAYAMVAAAASMGLATVSTSAAEQTYGAGAKTFPLDQANLGYAPGMRVVAAKIGVWTDYFEGTVTGYADDELTVSVDAFNGAGAASGFYISQVPIGQIQSVAGLLGPAVSAADLRTALDIDHASVGTLTDEYISISLSNTPGFETTRITFSAGQCRDTTLVTDIVLAAAISKDLTAVWAPGTGNGGRDAATALAAGQTWHCFAIYNGDTDSSDALFSQSPTAPTLPAGYSYCRRVGSILLEDNSGSGGGATDIVQFHQDGDWFHRKRRSTDYAATANGGGPFYRQLVGVPNGIRVRARFYFQTTGTADANAYLSGVFDPIFGPPPAFGGATQWAQVRRLTFKNSSNVNTTYETVIVEQWTDATAHVYTFSSDPADNIALGVLAWQDRRTLH